MSVFDRPGEHFTADHPTWNSAAVVLAAHALGGEGPTAGLFRGEDLPVGLSAEELLQAGERDRGRARTPPLATHVGGGVSDARVRRANRSWRAG